MLHTVIVLVDEWYPVLDQGTEEVDHRNVCGAICERLEFWSRKELGEWTV